MKNVFVIIICLVLMAGMTACGNERSGEKEQTTTISESKTVAIHAGEVQVLMDEARYYAYTAQATYEAYYISENREIDWNSKMTKEVTWQQGVKSIVLDDICRRECMYALASEYNITLTKEEEEMIDVAVEKYYSDTDKKLMSKIDIEKNRLKFVFEKEEIASKVENVMMATDKNLSDETYENWKTGNTVTAEKQWKMITFKEHIFTLEDIQ